MYLVTGVAGFIGFHVAKRLLSHGNLVIGIDSLNSYYDPNLKTERIKNLKSLSKENQNHFEFFQENLSNLEFLNSLFREKNITKVIHLAAQAGVRYSLVNPHAYVESNLVAFTNILEVCRNFSVEHLVYASTSSVYGGNTKIPFSEKDSVNHPLQFYAATKKANELMAHSYSHLFQLPTTGLRFFTVYGPWGRPDMALFLFTKNILEGKPIQVFNFGNHTRDFTFVEDIVEGIHRAIDNPAQPNLNWDSRNPDPSSSSAPYKIYNIGNNNPVKLIEYINALEICLGRKAEMEFLPLQKGDVPDTFADVSNLISDLGYKPSTSIADGVKAFVQWYIDYYKVKNL